MQCAREDFLSQSHSGTPYQPASHERKKEPRLGITSSALPVTRTLALLGIMHLQIAFSKPSPSWPNYMYVGSHSLCLLSASPLLFKDNVLIAPWLRYIAESRFDGIPARVASFASILDRETSVTAW